MALYNWQCVHIIDKVEVVTEPDVQKKFRPIMSAAYQGFINIEFQNYRIEPQ